MVNADEQQTPVLSPDTVGREFVRQYYTMLHDAPQHLHRFYSNESIFVRSKCCGKVYDSDSVIGQVSIQKKLLELNYSNTYARIRTVEAYRTVNNAIVVLVCGELSHNGSPYRKFVQTFVLAVQNAKKYYVHNDIFQFEDDTFGENVEIPPTDPMEKDSAHEECEPHQNGTSLSNGSVDNELKNCAAPLSTISTQSHPPRTTSCSESSGMSADQASVVSKEHSLPPLNTLAFVSTVPTIAVVVGTEDAHINNVASAPSSNDDQQPQQPQQMAWNNNEPSRGRSPADVEAAVSSTIEDGTVDEEKGPKTWAGVVVKHPFTVAVANGPVTSAHPPSAAASAHQTNSGSSDARNGPRSGGSCNTAEANIRASSNSANAHQKPQSLNIVEQYADDQQVFIGHLAVDITDVQIRDIFKRFGEIVCVHLNPTKQNDNFEVSRCGFVIFKTSAERDACLRDKPTEIAGRRLNVEMKKSKYQLTEERERQGGGDHYHQNHPGSGYQRGGSGVRPNMGGGRGGGMYGSGGYNNMNYNRGNRPQGPGRGGGGNNNMEQPQHRNANSDYVRGGGGRGRGGGNFNSNYANRGGGPMQQSA